jgi:glutamyl/glutaminyl-tRNA synthetase
MRRESYNWLVNELSLYLSKVHEFARLQLTYTILSKRKLIALVEGSMKEFLISLISNICSLLF